MLPISVCIISKNEEEHIEECCRRLTAYGLEIVLTDTGSTDRTVEIARKYTDRIYHFNWCNNFSAAKNYCMQKASHDWILSIDCDEYIEALDEGALLHCMECSPDAAGRILIRNRFTLDGQTSFEQVRVSRFVNRRYFQFAGAVHEQLVYRSQSMAPVASPATTPSIHMDKDSNITPVKVYPAPITILHVGYDISEEKMQEKCRRNITLLKQELNTEGPDPYLYYQLGQSCRRMKDYEQAAHYFDAGLSMDVDPALDYVQTMVESYGYTLLDLKQSREALYLLGVYDEFSKRADFVFLMGLIYMNNGLFDAAIEEFQKSTSMEEFAVEGVNSYKAFYNIGVIYECSHHIPEAIEAYHKCGDYEPAVVRLQHLLPTA